MFQQDQPYETVYDLAFLEGALRAAWALDSEYEINSSLPSESFSWGWYYWFLWFTAHAHELLPDDHPLKERFYCIEGTPYDELIPAKEDEEGWQVFRDTVADLALVRFVDWFPLLAEHPIALELADFLGIRRWLDRAREDTGHPIYSSFVRYDPYGSNWRRRCLPEYVYPVPLEITVDECRATFVWVLQMEHHITCALEEIEAIRDAVENAVTELDLDLTELAGSSERLPYIQSEWLAASEPEARQAILKDWLSRAARAREKLRDAVPNQPTEPIEDVVSAFDLFWSRWLSWYPGYIASQPDIDEERAVSLLAGFPPALDDHDAWELIGNTLGELPLARFCFWFAEVAATPWARQAAAELGIAQRLEHARLNPARPISESDAVPPLLSPRWEWIPSTLPAPTPADARALWQWLEMARERMRAILAYFVD